MTCSSRWAKPCPATSGPDRPEGAAPNGHREKPTMSNTALRLALGFGILVAMACEGPAVEPAGGGPAPGGPPSLAPTPLPLAPTPLPAGSNKPPAAVDPPNCGAESAKAVPLPVDIFILQDRSGSMTMPAQPTTATTKWDAV